MYNRYIPQPDGSYKKNRLPESLPQASPPPQARQSAPARPQPVCPPLDPPPAPPPRPRHKQVSQKPSHPKQDNILGFFKQLLPENMDTGDLIILLLLLLMAGDCEEDRNNALLTLALYFFM